MNENVVLYVLEDWMSNEIGTYKTLDEAEDKKFSFVYSNQEYINASTEEDKEDIENGILDDLYIYGLDKDGNKVPVQFG